MTVSTPKFTPELLITAPRRSPATPNASGTHALYTVSTYCLDSHSESREVKIWNIETGVSTLFSDDQSTQAPQWLVRDQILWLKSTDGGDSELWIGTAGEADKNPYLAGTIPTSVENVKTKELSDGVIAFAFQALSDSQGKLYSAKKAPKCHSSAREFETVKNRFWDSWGQKEHSTLWYTTLQKLPSGRYKLSEKDPVNALKDSGLVNPLWPSDPFGGAAFDISASGLLVEASEPGTPAGAMPIDRLWFIPLSTFTECPAPSTRRIAIPSHYGSLGGAVFSPNGKKIALTLTDDAEDKSTWKHLFVLSSLETESPLLVRVVLMEDSEVEWGCNPGSFIWSNDGGELYLTAEERGRNRVFKLPIQDVVTSPIHAIPSALTEGGAVSAFFPLSNQESEKRLFVNKSALVDSSIFALVDGTSGSTSILSSATQGGSTLGLNVSQVSEITFKGQDDYQVQAWVIKPSNFDKDQRYPVAFIIHGGPQTAHPDAWSTRWNAAIFAEQGYIVVCPNFTGSTGFGRAFADDVCGNWGGRPYNDITNCLSYVEETMPYADTSRSVILGGSYGGYMMNWIAGQPLAKKFKTLVCHDGIFSLANMLSSDSPQGLQLHLGGHLWENLDGWTKQDPARFTHNWTQPMLFIHSDNDFRTPITEGLAAFTVCQMRGIESRLLNFPDENHFVLKRENSLHWYRTVLGWLNKHTGVEGGVVLAPPVSEPSKKEAENEVEKENKQEAEKESEKDAGTEAEKQIKQEAEKMSEKDLVLR